MAVAHSCALCEESPPEISFCTACNFNLCDECWNTYPPHRKGLLGPQGLPHEKADPTVVQELKDCMDEPNNNNEHRLHQDDEETTWFGLERDDGGTPVLAEYRRYAAVMMQASEYSEQTRYPSLVSFIGQTGAGKSSLIKLLIDLKSDARLDNFKHTPVIGRSASAVPTSADVHLYLSPESVASRQPILYADCEGFNGGEQNPVAINAIELSNKMSPKYSYQPKTQPAMVQKVSQGTKRLLKWASRDSEKYEETSKRGYTVSEMYPRIFYAFSDVVVFVLDNPKTLEVIVEKLLEWADANYSRSINQPIKPHAIIVLNKSNTKTPDDQWDTINATAHLLSTTNAQLDDNRTFAKYAKEWRRRSTSRIDSMHDLLRCYYSTVHVVRIPEKSRYQLLNQQRQQLHNVITNCCAMSYRDKQDRELLTDVDEFGYYLSLAFDHFSETLDEPFDFVEASLKRNPSSNNFGDDLLQFAINLATYRGFAGQVLVLMKHLTPFIASCILLESVRKQRIGRPEDWFGDFMSDSMDPSFSYRVPSAKPSSYRDMCRKAITRYFKNHVPCDFTFPEKLHHRKRRSCDLRSAFHPTSHRTKSGIGLPSYEPGMFQTKVRSNQLLNWEEQILAQLVNLHTELKQSNASEFRQAVAKAHADLLVKFYETTPKNLAQRHTFVLNSMCIACLHNPAQHQLGCGHVICSQCAKDFGEVKHGTITLYACPLRDDELMASADRGTVIKMAPAYSGLRVLVLDGGGVRGIVELCVLRAIEDCLGIEIQKFFDLVVGTSTGGILALGLGHQGWTVDQCIRKFRELVGPIFTKRTLQGVYGIRDVQLYVKHSRYQTDPLEHALQEAFGLHTKLFPAPNGRLKTAVTAVSSSGSNAWLLPNYGTVNGKEDRGPKYQRYRPAKPLNELAVWEAARSTSAAPGFFKPYALERNWYRLEEWIDGALLHNNPVEIALEEARRLAETESLNLVPDIVLSVGSGLSKHKKKLGEVVPDKTTVGPPAQKSGWMKNLFTMVSFQIKLNTDADRRWVQVLDNEKGMEKRLFRINPDLEMDPPQLDDVQSVDRLALTVPELLAKDWNTHQRTREVSAALLASSFYFEREGAPINISSSMTELQGWIRCRLGGLDLPQLAKFFKQSTRPEFVVYNVPKDCDEVHIPVPMDKFERGTFVGLQVRIMISGDDVSTTIALRLPQVCSARSEYPVSGFPRQLLRLDFGSR